MLSQITDALRRGDHAAALTAARAAVAAEPANPRFQHLLGLAAQRNGDDATARAAFDRAIALAPEESEYHFARAAQALAEGDTRGAAERLQGAIGSDPNQLGAYVALTHLALARGDRQEAGKQLKLAQRVNAEHALVRVAEGYIAQIDGDRDLALRCFTAAAAADPKLATAQHAIGMSYLGRAMWPFAAQALQNAHALEPTHVQTLRGLVEAQRRQDLHAEALQSLDKLLALRADDIFGRALRADLRLRTGDEDGALADMLLVLDVEPAQVGVLERALPLLVQQQREDEATTRIEAAVAQAPRNDTLWTMRLWLSGLTQEDPRVLLDRWLAADAGSLACLDYLAQYCEAAGDTEQAVRHADAALAREPLRMAPNLVKLRSELLADPESALARAQKLVPAARGAEEERTAYAWQGLALDRLGRHDEAAASWREMVRRPSAQMPLPQPQPADQAPDGDTGGGLLVWSPVGLRIDGLLQGLQSLLGPRMMIDRVGRMIRGDGFGLARRAPGHPASGSAASWRAGVQARGIDPAVAIDWIPQVDGYTLAALRGAHLLALVADPRDLFLGWMVQGSTQDYVFAPEPVRSAEWLALGLEALLAHRDANPSQVTLVRMDGDAGQAAAGLEQALGLSQPLPGLMAGTLPFAPGHWRRYEQAFAADFARLAPIAARLGYPAA